MPRDPKAGKKKQTARQPGKGDKPGGVSWLYQCPQWPVYEVLLAENWQQEDVFATSLIARQSPRSGKIAVASFLVDLLCMGVKSAFVRICKSPEDYIRRVRTPLTRDQSMQAAEFDLVVKIITEGVSYAERLGLSPDPEYQQAKLLLAGANPAACAVEVPLGGSEGKPHFMAGPYDNIEQITTLLTRAVGPDGFYITMPAPEEALKPGEAASNALKLLTGGG